ncbi:DUF4406 domain-containing protein [Pseudomonas sp. BCA14]|uniref:DUF4406 domain-containing protein n=1 Tax=unclassified Pseudomonas TaxID=196821 RepID=UPI00106E40AF|nr:MULTISPECIES: DUF4406 domain-containing protein [unclassified Pseudomonas]TFF13687.1 DUF4406 domain-containing protein [Pseudomonas sp. JMN1]TFF15630.1 DUF4406 domain-containing protein [Pseudomonas sp. BCA17]TFF32037.1 DUF4406 domain-containing protein [Pseudomonas sp. BCA14]TFF32990.1 DUF4406 domain-containing protein [Pseudomonas sp. BCA13]
MPTENHIDCPALHRRREFYPYGDRVPRTVRMLKTVTADLMPRIGLAYIRGEHPVAEAGHSYPAWTNSLGAVAAVMPDGSRLGLRKEEFEVDTWHDLSPVPAASGVTLQAARANRVYVAGPMTGIADFNYPAFNAVADQLRPLGYEVENPADHGVVEGAQWGDYMAYDLTRLGLCGMIALLPDWEKSQGARLEVLIAEKLGMKVVDAHDLVTREAV